MVKLKEKQIGGITELDEDGYGSVEVNSARLTNIGYPVDGYDAATKGYVDSVASGGTSISVTSRGATFLNSNTITVNGGNGPESGSVILDLPNLDISSQSVSLGAGALSSLSLSSSVVIGADVMAGSGGGSNLVAIGYKTLNGFGGSESVVIGNNASTSGSVSNSVVIGSSALNGNTGGANESVVIGRLALSNMDTGSNMNQSVVIGFNAMSGFGTSPGDRNVAIGYLSALSIQNSSSTLNTWVGALAGPNLVPSGVVSRENVHIGYFSGASNQTTNNQQNTFIGPVVASNFGGGDWNTCVGASSGNAIDVGTGNTLVGYSSNPPTSTTDWYINIADVYYGEHNNATGKAAIKNGGTPIISTQTPELLIYGNENGDDQSPLGLITTGVNGAEVDFYVGDRDPDGYVTPDNAGDIYLTSDGYSSAIYQYDGYSWLKIGPNSLSDTLNIGNFSGGNDIIMSFEDVIKSEDGVTFGETLYITSGIGGGAGGSGSIDIKTADNGVATGTSGALYLSTGNGDSGGSGSISMYTGNGGAGDSGGISIGSGTGTGGNSGNITISTGTALSTFSGGYISMQTGDGVVGGNLTITLGDGTTGNGGLLGLATGNSDTSDAGEIQVTTGSVTTSGNGGSLLVNLGDGGSTSGNGGSASILGGDSTNGLGGSITISAGNSSSSSGGDVNIIAGTGSADGTVQITGDGYVLGDFGISGKLTVDGLIDPTGMVFDNQTTVPGGTPSANKATLWVRSSDNTLVLTDDSGADIDVGSPTSTDGYGNNVDVGFVLRRIKKFTNPLTVDPVTVNVLSSAEFNTRTSGMSGSFATTVRVYAYVCDAVGSGGTGTAFVMGSAFGNSFENPSQSTQDHTTGGITISIDYSDGISVTCTPADADGYIWVLDVEIIVSNMADFNSLPDLP